MSEKRRVEVFSAGCPCCGEVAERVKDLACSSCEVVTHSMHDDEVAERADRLGIDRVPAVVVDGELLGDLDEATLRDAGVGTPTD